MKPISLETYNNVNFSDVLLFLKEFWKVIISAGSAGILLSAIYLFFIPEEYEATALIQVAQISGPPSANLEDPAAVISRLIFNGDDIENCHFGINGESDLSPKNIKVYPSKGSNSIIEARVVRSNPELAAQCAKGVYGLIVKLQNDMLTSKVNGYKDRHAKVTARLNKIKDSVIQIEHTTGIVSSGFFYALPTMLSLEDERIRLEMNMLEVVIPSQIKYPINVAKIGIKKHLYIAVGFFGGVVLGIFTLLAVQVFLGLNRQHNAKIH